MWMPDSSSKAFPAVRTADKAEKRIGEIKE